jgi:F1F0 ATPase subunit 2
MAFLVGLGLGVFYFGGLWLTVKQLPGMKHPYRLIFSSLFMRLGISLYLFYLLIGGELKGENIASLLICFLVFLIIRSILIIYLKPH